MQRNNTSLEVILSTRRVEPLEDQPFGKVADTCPQEAPQLQMESKNVSANGHASGPDREIWSPLAGRFVRLKPADSPNAREIYELMAEYGRPPLGGVGTMTSLFSSTRDVFFQVERVRDNADAGFCLIQGIDTVAHVGNIGVYLYPRFTGNVLGGEAFLLLLALAFDYWNLAKVCCDSLYAMPSGGGRLFRSLFHYEGRRRNHLWVCGRLYDLHLFGATADDWVVVGRPLMSRWYSTNRA